jgi:hypothetical protein
MQTDMTHCHTQESLLKYEQQFLEREQKLERVVQKEADERVAADALIRQELENVIQVHGCSL